MKIEISQCQNTECNQKFTPDNIKLAVWLHGVILLTQGRPLKPDPLFASVSDKEMEDFDPQGYIGLTCPKCFETSLYQGSCEDVLEFKKQLQTMVSLAGSDPDDKSKQLKHDLRYYSPFGLEPTTEERFEVDGFIFDGPEDDPKYFQDELATHIADEIPGLWKWYCSYLRDRETPAGASTHILWFKQEQVSNILEFEKANGVRVFPRYHYITDLVRKIESLQRYNHQSERVIAAARSQHKRQEKTRYEKFLESGDAQGEFKPLAFDDFLKDVQSKITNVPQLTSDFLEMLISGPEILEDISGTPTSQCCYLWERINPFHGLEYPESFPAELEPRSSEKDLIQHGKKVDLIRENLNKQYVQEYLRENLVNYLEKYENLIQGNKLSYAHVWRLKETYLERLVEVVKTNLPRERSFSFKYEGPGWLIKYNEKPIPGLRDKGLKYIYFLICNKNKSFSFLELEKIDGVNPELYLGHKLEKSSPKDTSNKDGDKKTIGKKTFDVNEMMDQKGFDAMKDERMELLRAIEIAEENNDIIELEEAREALEKFNTYFQEYWIPNQKKKQTFVNKSITGARRKIEISIERALEKIESYNVDLYAHFAQSLYGLPKAFYKKAKVTPLALDDFQVMYDPRPDIDWYLG